MVLNSDVWAEHDSLVFEMLATKVPVLLMDHDAAATFRGRRLEVPRLSMYVASVEVTPDVLGEREFLAEKSLARSADRSSYTKNSDYVNILLLGEQVWASRLSSTPSSTTCPSTPSTWPWPARS